MIDVRDSFFQSDPFAFIDPSSPSFHVFNGQESFPISKCGWNSGWIRDCFGENLLAQVGGHSIICSGVSAGTTDIVMDYLHMMSEIVQGHNIPKPLETISKSMETGTMVNIVNRRTDLHHSFPTCERNGVDQGIHNVLVHSQAIPQLKIWDQGTGFVANMQAQVAKYDPGSHVVSNRMNQPSAVVHQYDRNPALQHYLFEKVIAIYCF
jgi:hypothetical protein